MVFSILTPLTPTTAANVNVQTSGASKTFVEGERLYFNSSAVNYWLKDKAQPAVWLSSDGGANWQYKSWATKIPDTTIWYIEVTAGTFNKIKLVRYNGSATDLSSNNIWNQTGSCDIDANHNCITSFSDGGTNLQWDTYVDAQKRIYVDASDAGAIPLVYWWGIGGGAWDSPVSLSNVGGTLWYKEADAFSWKNVIVRNDDGSTRTDDITGIYDNILIYVQSDTSTDNKHDVHVGTYGKFYLSTDTGKTNMFTDMGDGKFQLKTELTSGQSINVKTYAEAGVVIKGTKSQKEITYNHEDGGAYSVSDDGEYLVTLDVYNRTFSVEAVIDAEPILYVGENSVEWDAEGTYTASNVALAEDDRVSVKVNDTEIVFETAPFAGEYNIVYNHQLKTLTLTPIYTLSIGGQPDTWDTDYEKSNVALNASDAVAVMSGTNTIVSATAPFSGSYDIAFDAESGTITLTPIYSLYVGGTLTAWGSNYVNENVALEQGDEVIVKSGDAEIISETAEKAGTYTITFVPADGENEATLTLERQVNYIKPSIDIAVKYGDVQLTGTGTSADPYILPYGATSFDVDVTSETGDSDVSVAYSYAYYNVTNPTVKDSEENTYTYTGVPDDGSATVWEYNVLVRPSITGVVSADDAYMNSVKFYVKKAAAPVYVLTIGGTAVSWTETPSGDVTTYTADNVVLTEDSLAVEATRDGIGVADGMTNAAGTYKIVYDPADDSISVQRYSAVTFSIEGSEDRTFLTLTGTVEIPEDIIGDFENGTLINQSSTDESVVIDMVVGTVSNITQDTTITFDTKKLKFYFDLNTIDDTMGSDPRIHLWNSAGASTEWPGLKLADVAVNVGGGLYEVSVDAKYTGAVINDGKTTGDRNQTNDISVSEGALVHILSDSTKDDEDKNINKYSVARGVYGDFYLSIDSATKLTDTGSNGEFEIVKDLSAGQQVKIVSGAVEYLCGDAVYTAAADGRYKFTLNTYNHYFTVEAVASYTVAYDLDDENGIQTATIYADDNLFTLTAPAKADSTFSHWLVTEEGGSTVTVTGTTLELNITKNTTVIAVYEGAAQPPIISSLGFEAVLGNDGKMYIYLPTNIAMPEGSTYADIDHYGVFITRPEDAARVDKLLAAGDASDIETAVKNVVKKQFVTNESYTGNYIVEFEADSADNDYLTSKDGNFTYRAVTSSKDVTFRFYIFVVIDGAVYISTVADGNTVTVDTSTCNWDTVQLIV